MFTFAGQTRGERYEYDGEDYEEEKVLGAEMEDRNDRYELPWWEKYTLSIPEAAAYFRIGENKLRDLCNANRNADYVLWNGNRPQIKRNLFGRFIDRANAV